jgi:hypothetical protein
MSLMGNHLHKIAMMYPLEPFRRLLHRRRATAGHAIVDTSGRLGVNIHFTDPRPGEMQMIADAGITWVRMDFSWAHTERAKGEYDFSAYERLWRRWSNTACARC